MDAGRRDGGAADGGLDAGVPPLALTRVLPGRGESGGSAEVTLTGAAFMLGVSSTGTGAPPALLPDFSALASWREQPERLKPTASRSGKLP